MSKTKPLAPRGGKERAMDEKLSKRMRRDASVLLTSPTSTVRDAVTMFRKFADEVEQLERAQPAMPNDLPASGSGSGWTDSLASPSRHHEFCPKCGELRTAPLRDVHCDLFHVRSSVAAQPATPANYMQQLPGGICFAHGPYEEWQCPKWPACMTDPQNPEFTRMGMAQIMKPQPAVEGQPTAEYGHSRSMDKRLAAQGKPRPSVAAQGTDGLLEQINMLRGQIEDEDVAELIAAVDAHDSALKASVRKETEIYRAIVKELADSVLGWEIHTKLREHARAALAHPEKAAQ